MNLCKLFSEVSYNMTVALSLSISGITSISIIWYALLVVLYNITHSLFHVYTALHLSPYYNNGSYTEIFVGMIVIIK